MKKLLLICMMAVLGVATGCKDDKDTTVEQQEQGTLPDTRADTIPPPVTDTVVSDTVAANTTQNSGWYGNYSGSLPCGDCKGILTKITLNNDKTYLLSSQYIGKQTAPTIYKGTYNLDNKKIVTLDAEGDHLKFLVMEQEAMLKKLDKFGAPEQGGQEARYFLHKVM